MALRPDSDEIQPRVLRDFTALHQIDPSWAGSLILSLGLDAGGAALSIAANIAGAVTLAVDDDPAHLRDVIRTGACDFVVNSLDEAIRAMKNEVRKGAPLSVALSVDPCAVILEIIDRGLAPRLFATFVPPRQSSAKQGLNELLSRAVVHLRSLGARLVHFGDTPAPVGFLDSATLIDGFIEQRHWSLYSFACKSATDLRSFDAGALAQLPSGDTLRRRWLEAAPRILQRQRPPHRSLWLTPQEAEAITAGKFNL